MSVGFHFDNANRKKEAALKVSSESSEGVLHSLACLIEGDERSSRHTATRSMLPTPVAAPAAPAFNTNTPIVLNAQAMGTATALNATTTVGTTEHPSSRGHSTLEVTGQPPSTWYKDQFGRKATFELRVRRENRGCYGCIEQRHLSVQLLYESGKIVENQSILRVASGLCLNKQNETILAIRIMEVSKNHQNQKFRLQICLPKCPLEPNHTSGASVITEPILVLSKKNKRQVKPETENTKSKKSKFSPPTADEVADLLNRVPTHAETAPPSQMFASVSELESVPGDGTLWETETVRFKKPSDGVCLWANAAFNFLHRLQWQQRRAHPNSSSAPELMDSRHFECVVCGACYTGNPVHRPDCDLALLLQQTDSLDHSKPPVAPRPTTPATQPGLPRMETAVFDFAQQRTADNNVLSEKTLDQQNSAMKGFSQMPSFGSASLDLLAKNLNLNTWEGYSSLSKIMFSLEADMKVPVNGDSLKTKHRTKTDAFKMNESSTGTQHTSQSAQISLSLSSLVSNMKDLSPETAAFLQENDNELTGDASLLRSLSRVSLGDFVEDGDAKPEPDENDVRLAVTSLTAVMVDESKGVTESAVASIAAINFQHCGYPAFDKSDGLVGFYFLTETTSTPELRFLPNFYPLPPPMIRELQTNCEKWKSEHGAILNRQGSDAFSLENLKFSVIQAILRRQA